MKAPRKTVKRPIYRSKLLEKDVEIDISKNDEKDVKITKPENNDMTKVLNVPKIEFSAADSSAILPIEPVDNFLDDIDLNIGESFVEINDIDNMDLDLFAPAVDLDGFI